MKNKSFAVVGVSRDESKYGHQVFLNLKGRGLKVYPINPKIKKISRDITCYPSLKDLPETPDTVVTVVPPKITVLIVKEAAILGIKTIWMQPGSESKEAIDYCKRKNIKCITNMCIIK